MHTLFVAATLLESEWLRAELQLQPLHEGLVWHAAANGHRTGLLVTGIGMVNTALRLGQWLPVLKPERAINIGVAGSFDPTLALTQVVHVWQDSYADLGTETPANGFQPLAELGFPVLNVAGTTFGNTFQASLPLVLDAPSVHGLTVNTITGTMATRNRLLHQWPTAQVETMEGAAFLHSCIALGVPCAQLRAISNVVGPRDTTRWRLREAALQCQQAAIGLLFE